MDKSREKELFFVEVKEPADVRRNILESLKDIVGNLQRFEKFKEVRKEKIQLINKLGQEVKDINKEVNKLKGLLPHSKLRELKEKTESLESKKTKKTQKKSKKKAQKKPKKESKKPTTELERLQSELNSIEEKLKHLQ